MRRGFFLMTAFFILYSSCRELYNDYDSSMDEDYLVVEGMITDETLPYFVKLSKALAYSNNLDPTRDRQEPVQGAIVILRSDKGEEVLMHEEESVPGAYSTYEGEIQGEQGHSYWVYIRTTDGDEYESLPSRISEKPAITGIDMKLENKDEIYFSADGTQELVSRHGMNITTGVIFNNGSNFYKIDVESIIEMVSSISFQVCLCSTCDTMPVPYGCTQCYQSMYFPLCQDCYFNWADSCLSQVPWTFTTYCWSTQREWIPNIIAVENNTSIAESRNIPATFIYPYEIPASLPYSLPGDGPYSVFGYLINLKAYSIDNIVYEYFRNVKNQIIAYNKIFDPIPVELTGNIKCITDPKENVFGVFIATSIENKQFFILGDGTREETTIRFIDDFDSRINTYNATIDNAAYCGDTAKPYFWQDQYGN